MKSNFPFFNFMDCAFSGVARKSLPNSGSQRFSPVFSSRRFVVLGFIFSSVTHFELIFVYACYWIFHVAVLPLVNSALTPKTHEIFKPV